MDIITQRCSNHCTATDVFQMSKRRIKGNKTYDADRGQQQDRAQFWDKTDDSKQTSNAQEKGAGGEENNNMSYWERLKLAWRKTGLPNKLLIALTTVLALSNLGYVWYASKQFGAIDGQLGVMRSQMNVLRTDQRAWIYASGILDFPKDPNSLIENEPVSAHFEFRDTGKTPATDIHAVAARPMVIRNGVKIPFDYSNALNIATGALLPGDEATKGHVPSLNITHEERTDLVEGKSFIVFYYKIFYCDIFRVPHEVRRCLWAGFKDSSSAYDCTQYNAVDLSEEPNLKVCRVSDQLY
jgi:hypothetical protein